VVQSSSMIHLAVLVLVRSIPLFHPYPRHLLARGRFFIERFTIKRPGGIWEGVPGGDNYGALWLAGEDIVSS